MSSSLAIYNVDVNMERLVQLQLLLLEMERQLLIISAMIERVRSIQAYVKKITFLCSREALHYEK